MNANCVDVPGLFSGDAYFANPYATYAACLQTQRYLPVPGTADSLGIFDYHDVSALLTRGAIQVPRLRTFFPVPDPDLGEFVTLQHWVTRSVLHMHDGDHRHVRRSLERPMSAISVQQYAAHIVETVESLLHTLSDRRSIDVVHEFAAILPTAVMGRLLGLEPAEVPIARQAAQAVAYWSDSANRSRRDTLAARNGVDLLTGLLLQKLEAGNAPLLDALVNRSRSAEIETADILVQCILFLVASQATLRNLIANTVYLTVQHAQVRDALGRGELTDTAVVDETLRFEAPVQFLHRTVTTDFAGTFGLIRAETPVVICLGSAQRAEAFVADGHRFDPFRTQPASLAFGLAERACLGRSLARLTAAAAVSTLFTQRPGLSLAGPVRWGRSFYFRGIAELILQD